MKTLYIYTKQVAKKYVTQIEDFEKEPLILCIKLVSSWTDLIGIKSTSNNDISGKWYHHQENAEYMLFRVFLFEWYNSIYHDLFLDGIVSS